MFWQSFVPTKVKEYLANKVFVYFLKKKDKNNWHEVGNTGGGRNAVCLVKRLWNFYI